MPRSLTIEQETAMETGVASVEALADLISSAADAKQDLHLLRAEKLALLLDLIARELRSALPD